MAKKDQPDAAESPGREPEPRLSALDRAIMSAIGDGRRVGREDDPARQLYPDVWSWLTKTEAGRDYIMQPAVLTVQLGPEGVLASLTHRDLRTTIGVSCLHLGDVLPMLQAALTSENPAIRSWGKDLPQLKKRRLKS